MRSRSLMIGVLLTILATAANADGKLQFNEFSGDNPLHYGVWWWAVGNFPSAVTTGPNVPDVDLWGESDALYCYDDETKLPLDCPYTFSIKGVDDGSDGRINFGDTMDAAHIYGGHSHNQGAAPTFYQDEGSPIIIVTGGGAYTVSPDGKTVTGSTGKGTVEILVYMPENSGAIWIDETMTSPKNYYCISGCFDYKSWEWHETLLAGYSGMTVLYPNRDTGAGYPYYIARTPGKDPGHTDDDAEWGRVGTVIGIQTLAQEYENVTPWHGLLPLNDMSLPEGGLFDIYDDWNLGATPAHWDHRLGTAVDIEPNDNTGAPIPCPSPDSTFYKPVDNNYLRGILYEHDKSALPGATSPVQHVPGLPSGSTARVICETASRLHIELHSDSLDSLLPLTPVQP